MPAFFHRILPRGWWFLMAIALLISGSVIFMTPFPTPAVDTPRSVEIRQINGVVTFEGKPARVGDALTVGDRITTGNDSSATLSLDDGIGQVILSELTDLQVKTLDILPNGGKATRLFTNHGQVRAQVRPFTNPESRFEISFRGEDEDIEGGVAGSRGTEYGVAVSPTGQTGVSTIAGQVIVMAQNQSTLLSAGSSSLIFPGEPPTPARTTHADVELKLKLLSSPINPTLQVNAQVDPLNLVFLNGTPVATDRNGVINTMIRVPENRILRVVVRDPLGRQQVYELTIN